MNRLWHKRLPEFETFDRIELAIVPRYKTSGLSGDEWRQSVAMRFYFKGEMVHEEFCGGKMEWALMLVASEWLKNESPIPDRVIEIEKTKCDQPSCDANAVGRYLIKKEYGDRGEDLDQSAIHSAKYRQFCAKHARRGDCGREDADRNYEPLDTLKPEQSTNTEESPAAFGGVVVLDDGGSPEGSANA